MNPPSTITSAAARASLLTAALMLTGCMVGPDYHPTPTTAPDAWAGPTTQPADNASRVTPDSARLVRWWATFDDPLLTSLVTRAIDSNLDLKLAAARLRQARAARGIAVGGLWPDVQAGAGYSRLSTPIPGPGSGSQDSFRVGLDAAWELDIFGGTRRSIEAADADILAAFEDRRDVLVSLTAEVALDYIDLRGTQARLAIARKNLAAQRHSVDLTRKRQVGGFASSLDVANAESQASFTEAQLPTLEAQAQLSIYQLGVLLGREPGALRDELADAQPIPPVPPEVPVGLPSELLRRRPDIRRAEAQVHADTARIGVAVADLFPRFTLTGTIGLQSDKLASLGNWSSRFWSGGPSATWDIFNAGRVRSNIEVQKAIQEQSLITYRQTVLTAFLDTESALESYSREQSRTRPLNDAVLASTKALDLSTRLYTEGLTDFLNVLNAQRSLLVADDAAVQNRANVAINLVALYKALGGGWEDAEVRPAATPPIAPQPPAAPPQEAPATRP
ncbi:MAG: efflux transporter outer membrane subunit [Planctomycetes bacterium]|nr:efflux transporter outer membrane subunit [Planctomycetota bacterium]